MRTRTHSNASQLKKTKGCRGKSDKNPNPQGRIRSAARTTAAMDSKRDLQARFRWTRSKSRERVRKRRGGVGGFKLGHRQAVIQIAPRLALSNRTFLFFFIFIFCSIKRNKNIGFAFLTATNRAEATLTWSSCLNMLIPSSKMTTKRRLSLSSSILG
ncbi:unnamed protein product, partial [Musa acuminata subsp. burmannicoides]